MKKNSVYKLAYFVSHPIQYQAPLLRCLAAHPDIELNVFFLSDISTRCFQDRGFDQAIEWDIPLLEGYNYEFFPCLQGEGKLDFWHPLVYGMGRVLKRMEWDAAWFHGYAHYALLWGIYQAIRLHIPVFFRAESNLICTSRGAIKDYFMRWLVRHASALLWISSHNYDYYKFYGARDEQLFFTPYAVDNTFFQERAEAAQKKLPHLQKELELTEDIPVMLYASKFMKRKNPVLLLEAYSRLSQDGMTPPNVYLLYIGDGEERSALEKRIRDLGWQSHVKVLGFKNQSELPDYFALCDLFVLPSQREPFGLVINEVMNAGKAIICTNEVGCSRDLVYEGRNGFVVPAGEREALSQALEKALSDRSTLKQMGKESKKIIENWSFEQDVNTFLQALEKAREKRHVEK